MELHDSPALLIIVIDQIVSDRGLSHYRESRCGRMASRNLAGQAALVALRREILTLLVEGGGQVDGARLRTRRT